MNNNNRFQILYQKTDFNHHKICQFKTIFKCSKCKKNNTIMIDEKLTFQLCLFCGTPNYILQKIK
jgi:hypothetical protein